MQIVDVPNPPSKAMGRPALIFMHGALHAAWAFQFFQPYFAAAGFQTHAISMRGCGDTSQKQTTSTTTAEHVEDIHALLDILPNQRFVLVAHSFGGFVAQKVAQTIADPTRIAALVLLASQPPTSTRTKKLWRILRRFNPIQCWRISDDVGRRSATKDVSVCREMFFSSENSLWFDRDIEGDNVLREYMKRFSQNTLKIDKAAPKEPVRRRRDNADILTLAVWGTKDTLIDEKAARESAKLWDGELVMVEGAPHNLMLYSEWQHLAEIIRDWLCARFPDEV